MAASDDSRLSVAIIDVHPGREGDFLALAPRLKEVLERKGFCVYAQTVPDAGSPRRFYDVRHLDERRRWLATATPIGR